MFDGIENGGLPHLRSRAEPSAAGKPAVADGG
jgi:hypothetical protein